MVSLSCPVVVVVVGRPAPMAKVGKKDSGFFVSWFCADIFSSHRGSCYVVQSVTFTICALRGGCLGFWAALANSEAFIVQRRGSQKPCGSV